MSLRIEKMTECSSGSWGYFVAVYNDEECLGRVMTDGTLTPKECYESLKSNWEIDEMERLHYSNLPSED